jgi:predicted transcriptional regulator
LKIVKDSKSTEHDWWEDLSENEKKGIESGLKDIEAGRVFSHDEVKSKYGL